MTAETIHVVDMHTGGEPVRIVTAGYPPFPAGTTILEKRAHAREKFDGLRKLLMWEPRGHYDMYGAILVPPSLPGADLAVLFMHNQGYSTMCGHAVIALGRFAVDRGLVPVREPFTPVGIECPCGLVAASVRVENGRAGAVSFESVPAFALYRGQTLDLPRYGRVGFDVAYGGAFYAVADAARFGLAFGRSRVRDFADAATALTEAVAAAALPVAHPDADDLGFLYGSILTDGGDGAGGVATRNVCVFADAEVDRSPTGSGVTARLALMHAQGLLPVGEERLFESIAGSRFSGSVVCEAKAGAQAAVVARVGGRAFYAGRAEYAWEEGDELGRGFLLR
jgi:proline racemase